MKATWKTSPGVVVTLIIVALSQVVGLIEGDDAERDGSCTDPYKASRPVAVLFERSFVQHEHESEIPRFVLYEDGHVIFAKCSESQLCRYFQVKLSAVESDSLKRSLTPSATFLALKPRYDLVRGAWDQPEVQILLRSEGSLQAKTAYGLFYDGAMNAVLPSPRYPGPPETLPSEFTSVLGLK